MGIIPVPRCPRLDSEIAFAAYPVYYPPQIGGDTNVAESPDFDPDLGKVWVNQGDGLAPCVSITHRERGLLLSPMLSQDGSPNGPLPGVLRCWKIWCRRRDLNPRPPAYEADALPLSYAGTGRNRRNCARLNGRGWHWQASPPARADALI